MRIDIDVFRTAVLKLLDHTEKVKGKTVDIPDDLYWFIPKESLNDPTTKPANLTLGSLTDDWTEVSAIAVGRKDPFGYGLVWAASLLRALGDRTY